MSSPSPVTRLRVHAADVALMAVGVVGVSMSGPLIAAMASVPALAIAFWRMAIATVVTAPLGTAHRHAVRQVSAADLRMTAVAALALAAHFALWVSSLKLTSVASATALVCLQAGWVVLFSWMGGVRPDRRTAVGLTVCFAGVLVVTGVDFTVSPEDLLGDLLALLGGMGSAVYMIVGGRVRQRTNTSVYTLLCYGMCSLVLVAVCLAGSVPLAGFAPDDWAQLVALAVASQLLGHSVFNHVLAAVSPTVVSLVILLEVPGAALLAGLFLPNQTPPVGVYAGLAVLLCGLAVVTVARKEVPATAPPD